MEERPILTLDTSAINKLADDPNLEALIAGLKSGFFIRLTFTNVEEAVATTSAEPRRKLLDICGRLLSCGDCIDPPGELLTRLIASFEDLALFDWRGVDVRLFPEAEQQIAGQGNFPDSLAKMVREEARTYSRAFDKVYADAKPNFDTVFAARPNGRPANVFELVSGLQNGGQYWTIARNLHMRLVERPADDVAIGKFVAECPPFHALMIAFCAALYDRNAKPPNARRSLRAGWADTLMAVCLPYCNQFVTDDRGQLACYKEVVSLAALDVTVRSYDEFRSSLCLA